MRKYRLRPHDATFAEIADIDACAAALNDLTPTEANIILDVYDGRDFPGCVRSVARRYQLRDSYVWTLIDRFSVKFAYMRGLL